MGSGQDTAELYPKVGKVTGPREVVCAPPRLPAPAWAIDARTVASTGNTRYLCGLSTFLGATTRPPSVATWYPCYQILVLEGLG